MTSSFVYILRRVILPSGRSRFFINDEPATASSLAKITENLIDIHEQNMHLLLASKSFQTSVLDSFCSNGTLMGEYKKKWERVNELKSNLYSLEKKMAAYSADKEYQQFQLSKLEEAALQSGELESLEREEKLLSNAESIKMAIDVASKSLEGEQFSIVQSIKDSAQNLSRFSALFPNLQDIVSRLNSSRIEIRDIIDELNILGDKIEVSSKRLEEIRERLSLLYSLLRRYNVSNVDELISIREELLQKLSVAEGSTNIIKENQRELKENQKELESLALKISKSRTSGAPKLSKVLEESIKDLGLKSGKFEIKVEKALALSPSGGDDIKFLFAANPGEEPIEIEKVASGAELSRVMLCLKKIMGERENMPTMIFDEIDAGVSGSIADKIGEMLYQMGHTMQIIAITHLPQVASKGTSHILVYKEVGEDKKAHTNIKFLSGDSRTMEIARLLSGKTTTKQAIENAKVLLNTKN